MTPSRAPRARPSRRLLLRGAGAVVAAVAGAAGCAPSVREVPGSTTTTHRYGDAEAQVADLLLPPGAVPDRVAVLVHGGYWQSGYDRTLEDAVAADLVGRGWAVWNVDYRGAGDGGGWPGTSEDAEAAVALLTTAAAEHDLPLGRTALVGHSAGGQLALWAATLGARTGVTPVAVVAQAAVADLRAADDQQLGGGAVQDLLGGRCADEPARCAALDPLQLVPIGVPLLVVTGADDTTVPVEQSTVFAAAAEAAGDDVELRVVPGEDHFAHLDPASTCWREARAWLEERLPAS